MAKFMYKINVSHDFLSGPRGAEVYIAELEIIEALRARGYATTGYLGGSIGTERKLERSELRTVDAIIRSHNLPAEFRLESRRNGYYLTPQDRQLIFPF